MEIGAMIKVQIEKGAIRPEAALERLKNPAHGGETLFLGRVRNRNQGRDVTAVSYDCHAALAKAEIEKIAAEAQERWGMVDIVVFHGTGRLPVGDVSVAVAASSPHREEAFEACRYVIEELKVRAPIWKQEHYVDGDSEWLKGHELCRRSHAHEHRHDHSRVPT